MKIDILGLQAFLCVAEHGAITQAAAVMNLSPTALSHRIRKLEDALGVELFARSGRQLALTQAGTTIVPRVRSVLRTCEGCIDELRAMAAPRLEIISMACLPSLAANWLPRVLAEFRRMSPNVRIRLHDRAAPEILELVQNGMVDFAVSIASGLPPNVDVRKLQRVPYVALCHRTHRLSKRARVEITELASEALVCLGHRDVGRLLMEEAFARRKQPFRPALEVNSAVAANRMVAAGLGIALLPRFTIDQVSNPGVVAIPLQPARFHITLGIVTPPARPLSCAASNLADCIVQAMKATRW